MGVGQKRRILVRDISRSLRQFDCLGPFFRVVVRRDGHAVVEAETLHPASDEQLASLSAKLLDALTEEVSDVVREAAADGPVVRLTLRLVRPGTLARPSAGRRSRRAATPCRTVH
jgi:hypothetical protein